MKITLPDGTTIEGTQEEIGPWLPPKPNWDGSWPATCQSGPKQISSTSGFRPPPGTTLYRSNGRT